MKKLIFLVKIIFLVLSVNAQTLELNGGYILNHFHDFGYENSNPHYRSDYNNGDGYSIQLGLEDLKYDILRFRFTLGYSCFGGNFNVSSGGLGGGGATWGSVNKSLISLGIYPIGFKIGKRIDLNLGFEVSALVYEDFEGMRSAWIFPYNTTNYYDLKDEYDRLSSLFYVGLSARIAYNIKLAESLFIYPQYSFYLGLSPEFEHSLKKTKSMRHYFSMGIKKQLGKSGN